ncbi:hypothetical protein [Nocardia altamirensis]|uniref:hypothetical protein n=1 Tax=Nocardia altamirensis TaxID=472158 RepID=UPI0009FE6B91|nr:hypothetical protein [Nocardia altamirensis]
MTTPMQTPATEAAVKTYLRLADPSDDADVTTVVNAVNSLMVQWFSAPIPPQLWPESKRQGAVMLAARLFRRRNSPAGVESFGELGPIYVQRNDPDLAILLGLGSYARPAVG